MEQMHIADNTTITFKIKYESRKSVSLKFISSEVLLIKAPYTISKQEIMALVMKKLDVIERLYRQQKVINENQIRYKPGQCVPFQDKWYPVKIMKNHESQKAMVTLEEDGFVVATPNSSVENVSYLLKQWYYQAAKDVLSQRTKFYGSLMGVHFARICIKDQKTRWGSCSSKRNINYNWKLILMPAEVLDYVVVHELAHLKEMNHSSKFWCEVEKVLPSYKERRAWLRENGEKYVWNITDNRSIN